MTISTYDELEEEIRKNAGFITLNMATLRDIHGVGKLGVHVVTNIHEKLDGLGLGHFPLELPLQQWETPRSP